MEDLAGYGGGRRISQGIMRKTRRCLHGGCQDFCGGTGVRASEDKAGKLICEKIMPFDEARKELWIQFPDPAAYQEQEPELMPILRQSDGQDQCGDLRGESKSHEASAAF